jgi:RNA polymerase sigma-70 factor (ECF subfamily)
MDTHLRNGPGVKPDPQENLSPFPLSAEQVYYDYAPRVYNMARRMVRSDVDAEDVTQDVLLQVVRKLPTFRGDSAFPTWLHRVTVNAALSHRRKRAVREERRADAPFDAFVEDGAVEDCGRGRTLGPDAQVLARERRRQIERAIAALPEVYRKVFLLADVDGQPNADIAEAMRLSLSAVKSRLHRARQLMRDALASYFEESAV